MTFRHAVANLLNERGRQTESASRAIQFYKLASRVDPRWSVPWYNLGFQTKYLGQWDESARFNQRAAKLAPTDEAAWWNLGIAATALRDWPEARRAWRGCGIELDDGPGEVSMPPVTACVRLNPRNSGEVVWGERLDPARIVVLNVPLPESDRCFNDIILNDGASNGTRERNGAEVPVFDELAVWQTSTYSTFQAELNVPSDGAEDKLREICHDRGVGVEDWSTIRILCAECSRGNPKPHDCKAASEGGPKRFGFGAHGRDEVEKLLIQWATGSPEASHENLELVLKGKR